MGWVEIAGFQVGLAPAEGRLEASEVAQGADEVCSVEQLCDADSSSYPVAGRDGVLYSLGDYSRSNCVGDGEFYMSSDGNSL